MNLRIDEKTISTAQADTGGLPTPSPFQHPDGAINRSSPALAELCLLEQWPPGIQIMWD